LGKQWVIAIDGPSGSGKSTCAKLLAKNLDLLYIDTGAMYRALGFWAKEQSVPLDDESKVQSLLNTLNLEYGVSDQVLIQIDGTDLTQKIREHEVSKLASTISQIPIVREFLVDFQRTLATTKVCVMEGRDIGSVVFPNAFCKFFITTAPEERARRRLEELKEKGETDLTLETIIKDIEERDATDRNRSHSPLIQTEDAILVENGSSLDDTLSTLTKLVKEKAIASGINL
tara:strand:- start:22366 stop:23055 length:690 start_codon:yes stop_codon:yes gene_type:complete